MAELIKSPCPSCKKGKPRMSCGTCAGTGAMLSRPEPEKPEWDESEDEAVTLVVGLHDRIERDGLHATLLLAGSIKPSVLGMVDVFRGELARLEYEDRVQQAKKERRTCRKKP